MNITPSQFLEFPILSILSKSEFETVARNIMVILFRTGNVFRELSFDEYKKERLKDGNFTEDEKIYFDKVSYLSKGVEKEICTFSPAWNICK
jgi:hypothetical protein